MAASKSISGLFLSLLLLLFACNSANVQLKVGFYSKTCPKAEAIVKKIVEETLTIAPSLAGPLLRMHFHDCFVRGYDGSVLLNASKSNLQVEKDVAPNQSLQGFQIIDKVKSALEKACPGIVSCADIIALVSRDVTSASMGPYWEVETGRRDGKVSIASEALTNLAPPTTNISTLITMFQAKGLNFKDVVVLSRAHTIGTSHCFAFTYRLYNFTGKGINNDSDPTLDPEYAQKLKVKCSPTDNTTLVEMDPGSFRTFDASYYAGVSKRRGAFQSDAALLDSSYTKGYVELQAVNKGSFFEDFGVSMVKMGRIGVLTGSAEEIRKVCSKVN